MAVVTNPVDQPTKLDPDTVSFRTPLHDVIDALDIDEFIFQVPILSIIGAANVTLLFETSMQNTSETGWTKAAEAVTFDDTKLGFDNIVRVPGILDAGPPVVQYPLLRYLRVTAAFAGSSEESVTFMVKGLGKKTSF